MPEEGEAQRSRGRRCHGEQDPDDAAVDRPFGTADSDNGRAKRAR